MDSGLALSASLITSLRRSERRERGRGRGGREENLDRFIPNRSAIDWEYATTSLTEAARAVRKQSVNCDSPLTQAQETYRERLAEAFGYPKSRILAFRENVPVPVDPFVSFSQPSKPRLRRIPQSPLRVIGVDDMLEGEEGLNLLDWGSTNLVSIALGNSIFLMEGIDGKALEYVNVGEEDGPITSVKWAPDGTRLAYALNSLPSTRVELWDSVSMSIRTTLENVSELPIGSMDWLSNSVLTTGGFDSIIVDNDVRMNQIAQTYKISHGGQVRALKWSPSSQQLAAGASDGMLYIWDRRQSTKWLHKIEQHASAVAWCPFQRNLLASCGDQCIKFWNTQTAACLNSVDTGSKVTSLLWNNNNRELLSFHDLPGSQLTLWKYPSMVKMSSFATETSTIVYTASSPGGCTVAFATADKKLLLWQLFGTPEVAKPASKVKPEPFPNFPRIR